MGFADSDDKAREKPGFTATGAPARAQGVSRTRVYVVIVAYGNWDQTEQCLASLSRLRFSSRRVILVDNGSSVSCPGRVLVRFPDAELLVKPKNLGFADGCNTGIRHARKQDPDYIWLLNNDTEPQPDSLTALVELSDSDSRLGAVGSLLLDPGAGRPIQAWGGGRISSLTGLSRALRESHSRLDYVCGASLLVRCAALDDVGLLDPGFFLYWEDTDLCFRLRAAGWQLATASQSVVVHKGSGSAAFQSPFYDYHFTASSIRFFRLYHPLWALPVLVSVAGRITMRIARGRFKNVVAVWKAFHHACADSAPARLRSWTPR